MKISLYKEIIKVIYQNDLRRDTLELLVQRFPELDTQTIGSIIGQEIKKRTKKSYGFHGRPETSRNYYNMFIERVHQQEEPGILLRMADDVKLCPSLLAKLILDQHLQDSDEEGEVTGAGARKADVNFYLRDTSLIADRDLAYEIFLCNVHDDFYSPYADAIKHTIGVEYEVKLKKKLMEVGVPFVDEDVLRKKGFDKTPDVKLEVPIAVDGHVVNWIESKGSFGDVESHAEYLRDQYWSYWNRFGPGLVIYWFGYVESIEGCGEKGILVRDKFPADIEKMEPLSLAELPSIS